MRKFADYTKFASPACPNLPKIVFARAMLNAAREYFTQTQAWQEVIEIDLTQGIYQYDMPLPWEAGLITSVLSVSIDDVYLGDLKTKLKPDYEGTPKYFNMIGKSQIEFMPIPSASKKAMVTVNLKPSIQTDRLPLALMDEHFEGLIAGAIWEIKRLQGDWYDPQDALNYRAQFEAFIDQKRIEMAMNNSNNELMIDFRESF